MIETELFYAINRRLMWSVFLNVYSNGCRLEGSLIRSVLVVEEAAIVLWTEDGDGYAGQQISWEARFFETHRFSLIWLVSA